MSKSSKKLEDDFSKLGINLKNNPHILEQLREFNEFQKKFGIKIEKGANYTLKHPFERIKTNPKKLPHRKYRKPFHLGRQIFIRISKNKLQTRSRKDFMLNTEFIDANYDYFQKVLPELMKKHLNKIAVVKDQKVIKVFNTVAEAHQFTLDEKYQHGHFIIQEINNTVHHISRIL